MSESTSISIQAMELLSEIAGAPDCVITHTLLASGSFGYSELVEGGWLLAAANAQSVVCEDCHEGHVADVETDSKGGLRHRCEGAGWVTVSPEQLRRYRLDEHRLVRWLSTRLGIPKSRAPVELKARTAWDLGDVRLGRGHLPVSLFFVVGHDAAEEAEHLILRRRRRCHQLVLALGSLARPRPQQPALTIIDLLACRKAAATFFELDTEIMDRAISGLPYSSNPLRPVQASADFSLISLGGREFVFSGSKQRDVVRQLFEAWQAGQPRVSVVKLLEGAESNSRKMSELFKGHLNWRDLISSKAGFAWLRTDELPSDEWETD